MQTPLNASASTAGALFSNTTFEVPQFQREYSWLEGQVEDFWNDLQTNLNSDTYFLGLIILTEGSNRKHVVDGQQRLITMSLLAAALYHEALARDRKALADRISANFLRSIDYQTDLIEPRVRLSDEVDDETFQTILEKGQAPSKMFGGDTVSQNITESFKYLQKSLRKDLQSDPFKRLGTWTDFLTHRVYFAVFVHQDPSSAYQVYEVINTRGKELTTADLLKNHILSLTSPNDRQARYEQWQSIANQFPAEGTNSFVQYIRHAVTTKNGHVLPKDLFSFLAGRLKWQDNRPPHSPDELMRLLEDNLPLYSQMIDPSLAGPAEEEMLAVFTALNGLNVLAVRPILLSIFGTPDATEGMEFVLRLVVRRIVVGNLGTGNVERRLGEAAKKVDLAKNWKLLIDDLRDLNPQRDDFMAQIRRRSFNKSVLTFLRRSIIQTTTSPDAVGVLHFICPRQAEDWQGMNEEDRAYWCSTIGNTFLSNFVRRAPDSSDWQGFKEKMLGTGVDNEIVDQLEAFEEWNSRTIEQVGKKLAKVAGDVWYD